MSDNKKVEIDPVHTYFWMGCVGFTWIVLMSWLTMLFIKFVIW